MSKNVLYIIVISTQLRHNVLQCVYEQITFHGKQLNFSLSCFTGAPYLMYLYIGILSNMFNEPKTAAA